MSKYIRKHFVLLILALVLTVISFTMVIGISVFKQFLIDLMIAGNMERFITILLYAAAFASVMGVAFLASTLIGEKFSAVLGRSIQKDLYDGIIKRNRSDFEAIDNAEYISVLTNDINIVEENFIGALRAGMGMIAAGITSIIIMVIYSPSLTAVSIGCSLISMIIPIFFSKPMEKRQKERSEALADFTVRIKETLAGRDVISALGLFGYFNKLFYKQNISLASAKYRFGVLKSGSDALSQVLNNVVSFIVILASGILVIRGSITVGTFVLFNGIHGASVGAIIGIFRLIPILKSIKPISEKIECLSDYNSDKFVGTVPPSFNERVEIRDLNFQYNEDTPLIHGLNISISRNDKLVIIGSSGSGKTTFVKLLSGDYAGYEGDILYDSQCLRGLKISDLHKIVTVINQYTHIFNDTIRFNICLGDDFADEALENAMFQSGVKEFLQNIPNGVDGDCGENGVNLSGGQRQKIAIARALIRDVDFIIIDEGVSAVDVETANEIESKLLAIPNLTLITITHRVNNGLLEKYNKVLDFGAKIGTDKYYLGGVEQCEKMK